MSYAEVEAAQQKSQVQRRKFIADLKGEPKSSRRFVEALRDADIETLGEAIKECVLKPSGALVNRRRIELLVDHLVSVVKRPPKMELSKKDAAGG